MRLTEVLKLLRGLDHPVFYTDDIGALLNISSAHASQILGRLENSNHIVRLKRGLWALPDKIDPLSIPNYLLAPNPAYISFYSALYFHNVIDQIPSIVYVATLQKTKQYQTPIVDVSAHQIHPDFFFGYTFDEKTGVKMATAEKALIDTLYLSMSKSGGFKALPEVDFDELDVAKAKAIIKKIPSKSRRRMVELEFDRLYFSNRSR